MGLIGMIVKTNKVSRCYATPTHFSIQIIRQQIDEVTLYRELIGHSLEVVRQFVVCRDDDADARRVELRSAGATEYLQHVQYAQVDECAVRLVVDFCTLRKIAKSEL